MVIAAQLTRIKILVLWYRRSGHTAFLPVVECKTSNMISKSIVHYNTTKNVYYNKKNRLNNIEVIAIVNAKCCNKIWSNKFVLQKNFVAIDLKYFNENFDVIIYLLLQ